MKLDPKPPPVICDRCGKTTTKYQEVPQINEYPGPPGTDGFTDGAFALLLGLHHEYEDVCESCMSVLLSCVKKAGPVEHKPRGTRKAVPAP